LSFFIWTFHEPVQKICFALQILKSLTCYFNRSCWWSLSTEIGLSISDIISTWPFVFVCMCIFELFFLGKKDMDVNEDGIQSNFTLIKIKELLFYCSSTFHSQDIVFLQEWTQLVPKKIINKIQYKEIYYIM